MLILHLIYEKLIANVISWLADENNNINNEKYIPTFLFTLFQQNEYYSSQQLMHIIVF